MNNALESITSIPPPFNMVVLVVFLFVIGGMVTTVVQQIRKYASHRLELEFKRELLDRGLPVDEIERLVRARSSAADSKASCK